MAQSEMDYMNIGKGNVIGIDTTNVVKTFTKDSSSTSTYDHTTWTATEDCIIIGMLFFSTAQTGAHPTVINVDGVIVNYHFSQVGNESVSSRVFAFTPLKKGQTVEITCAYGCLTYLKAYAPKY